ncbi:YhcN/YlaJ family sporulation lipoprotein [Niallia sp. Krafla_26]|uniref:YhcN/YlaJ family sporulation lipoprotein n=1 Tax=Niallia sp. Krafla_26 TaxID=3064703 RepID=UPI003D1838AB
MKLKSAVYTISLSALLLSACGTDDQAMNNRNARNGNGTYQNVNYRTPINDNRQGMVENRMEVDNKNNDRMRVADQAANKIADLPEVGRANVIVTDNNAYVAINTENNQTNNEIAKNLEKRISQIVKSTDRNIDNVYVSQDPDFFNNVNNYSNDIRNGRSVEGFFDEFGDMVRRVFPTAR